MIHSIFNPELKTELSIDETLSDNVCISITEYKDENDSEGFTCFHYLSQVQLHSFIGTLLHVQAKKRTKN